MKKLSFVISILLVAACGGAGKGTASSKADATCPATAATIKEACGCRPTEQHYVSMIDQLGSADSKDKARQCATGTNAGAAMKACLTEKGVSSSTLALAGDPLATDDKFDACVAALPAQ